jgi:hypothetical protein
MENKGLDWFATKICHAKDLASQSWLKNLLYFGKPNVRGW